LLYCNGTQGYEYRNVDGACKIQYATNNALNSFISSGDNFGEMSTGRRDCALAPYCLGAVA
jgi:hypothetical protein